jgi:hypothetical protein
MSNHVVMRMEDLRPEDFDDFDPSQAEYHDARPVRGNQVTVILSVPLTRDDFVALCAIEKRDGRTIIEIARDAIHAYVVAQSPQEQQPAPPQRRAS